LQRSVIGGEPLFGDETLVVFVASSTNISYIHVR
jgi:hypothetical protein